MASTCHAIRRPMEMPRKYRRRSTIGSIEQRGSKFRARWTDKILGSQQKSGFETYQEADEFLLEVQLSAKSFRPTMKWDRYWRVYVEPTFVNLSEKTAHEYRRQWRHDLEPFIGGLSVGETTWRTVQKVMDELPSNSVQTHAFALLRKMCGMAIRDGILQTNPCDRSIRFKPKQSAPKLIPDAKGVLKLLSDARGSIYEPVLLLMLGCGLRVEEVLALNWEDLSRFEDRGSTYALVDISKAIVMVGSRAVEKGTKNDDSTRYVIVGDPFAARLFDLAKGKKGPLIPGKNGRMMPSSVSHGWRDFCNDEGISYITLGSMRSIYATIACEAADSSLVSLVMGHNDGTTRGKNYQQATLRGAEIVADMYGEYLIAEKTGQKMGMQKCILGKN